MGITFTGHIVFVSGLFRSTAYDANIFEDTRHLHPQFPWEMNLGDGHFATVPRFFSPAQRIGGRQLRVEEQIYNKYLQLPRSRIEHMNTVLKNHAMFKHAVFRGHAKNLHVFVKVSGHAAAVEQRYRGDRYDGFGWWPHVG